MSFSRGISEVAERSCAFVMTHVLAYMFTLESLIVSMGDETQQETYRSIRVPGMRADTLLVEKPNRSKRAIYHGRSPAERRKTRPSGFKARFSAAICVAASDAQGSNQSIESITCGSLVEFFDRKLQALLTMAIDNVPGMIFAITSLISSVWIRKPSNAPGFESLA